MLVVVVLLFAVLWIPYQTLVLLSSFVAQPFLDPWVLLFCLICACANSAIHPIIYSLMSQKFQAAFRRLCQCRAKGPQRLAAGLSTASYSVVRETPQKAQTRGSEPRHSALAPRQLSWQAPRSLRPPAGLRHLSACTVAVGDHRAARSQRLLGDDPGTPEVAIVQILCSVRDTSPRGEGQGLQEEVEEVESRPGVGVGGGGLQQVQERERAGSGAQLRGQTSPTQEPFTRVCAVRTSAEWDEQAQAHLPSCFPFCGDHAASDLGPRAVRCLFPVPFVLGPAAAAHPSGDGAARPAELLSPGLLAHVNESLLTPGARNVHMR
ncbi:hypothetical protein ABFV05_013199 [Capra hircus]